MKIVIQRVKKARVSSEGKIIGEIGKGCVVFIGVKKGDTEEKAIKAGRKIANLRIFEGKNGKMNLNLKEVKGEVLLVSQFTLYGNALKGRKLSFDKAAPSEEAFPLYKKVRETLEKDGISTKTGKFGANMDVDLINEGPVTVIVEF